MVIHLHRQANRPDLWRLQETDTNIRIQKYCITVDYEKLDELLFTSIFLFVIIIFTRVIND